MKPRRKRILLLALCALAGLLALAWPLLPMQPGPDRLASLPAQSTEHESQEIELSGEERDFLAGASALQRIIVPRGGAPLILTVIDGSGNRHAVHDPAYCLAGGGWRITGQQQVKLLSGEATQATLQRDGESMEAMWFFDDGSGQFTSPLTYWWRASLRRASKGRSGPEPVLVMLRTPPGSRADWPRVRRVLLPAIGFP